MVIGLHCSHEQHPPSALLRHAQLAAQVGFTAAMCSDHFRPWSERQGHSGFAWSWLGAALATTSLSFGTVCAPGQRYHPAVIAQAAATLGEMFPHRFWLAVGSGEWLNESITGTSWPSKADRNERLQQSADVIRRLWAGEDVAMRGQVSVDGRLFVKAASAPLLLGAALTPDTASWVATWADGLMTAAGPRDNMRQVVRAFREGGGDGKPMYLQVALSFAPTDEEALDAAREQWAHCSLPSQLLADLATPQEFDRAVGTRRGGDVKERVRVSADIARHSAWIEEDLELGFDRVYLHNVARQHQERFIEACGRALLRSR